MSLGLGSVIPDAVVPRTVAKSLNIPNTAPDVVRVGVPRTVVALRPFPEESAQTLVVAL